MLTSLIRRTVVFAVASVFAVAAQQPVARQKKARIDRTEHTLVGELKRVDATTKTIVVKTAEGAEESVKFTEHTTVRGLETGGEASEKAAHATALAGKEGAEVLVRYTGEGAGRTAVAVKHFAGHPIHTATGAIVRFDQATGVVVMRTARGSEETFHLGKEAVIDTEHGTVRLAEYTGKEGEQVTAHYTEEAGRKVVHAFKVAGHALTR